MENVTFSPAQIAEALVARNVAIEAVKAKGIEFIQGGTTLPLGEHTVVIGLEIRCPEFERKGKMYSIILQTATKDGENADFVIPESHKDKYLPGTTCNILVYNHEASGNKRIKVVSYSGSATAPQIGGTENNANNELEAEYEVLEASLPTLSGVKLKKAQARMSEIEALVS